jgi:hypothetical protein
MPYAALERMLRTERYRQRAGSTGFSTPGLCRTPVDPDAAPMLATNMRGTFLPTRRDREGFGPFGFSLCPVGAEGPLLIDLHRVLWGLSVREGWKNRCTSIQEAVDRLHAARVEPKSLVVSETHVSTWADFDIDAARTAMSVQGYVAVVNGMQVLLSDLPEGSAFVAASPSLTGVYTRIGDHLGVLLQRVDRALMLVQGDVAG